MQLLLAGWFGSGNVGDEAIQLAMIESLAVALDQVAFDVLSFDLERSRRLLRDDPRVNRLLHVGSRQVFHRTDFFGLFQALREADLILVGGGGLFQDLYNWYFPPFFGAVVLVAKLLRKPTILYGVGIGPLSTWLGRSMTWMAARLADLIVVRDESSAIELWRLGIRKDVSVTADLAFSLRAAQPERGRALLSAAGMVELRHPLVGVVVQGLLPWGDHQKRSLAAALDHVVEDWGGQIVFIPFGQYRSGAHVGGEGLNVDSVSTLHVRSLMRHKAETTLLLGEHLPSDLMAAIGHFDLILSMRYHGLVMATAMGVPCIALTYAAETKLRSFMAQIATPRDVLDVETLTQDALESRLDDALAHRRSAARREVSALVTRSHRSAQLLGRFVRGFPALSSVVAARQHRSL